MVKYSDKKRREEYCTYDQRNNFYISTQKIQKIMSQILIFLFQSMNKNKYKSKWDYGVQLERK